MRCRQYFCVLSIAVLITPISRSDESKKPIAPPNRSGALRLPTFTPEQLANPKEAAKAADELEKAYEGKKQPEAVRMLSAILRGSQLGPQEGWFGPAESRFTWKWLAQRHEIDPKDGAIERDKFRGPEALFKKLDRDGDGRITAGDLDWSDRNPWVQQAYMVNRLFRRINSRGDGKLTQSDLEEFFKRTADGKEYLTSEDLRGALWAEQQQKASRRAMNLPFPSWCAACTRARSAR